MKSTLISKLISKASALTLAAVMLSSIALSGCGQSETYDNQSHDNKANLADVDPFDSAGNDNSVVQPSISNQSDISSPSAPDNAEEIIDDNLPSDNANISGAVVVFKSVLNEIEKCSFSCVGSLDSSGVVTPFTFAVPLSDIVDESGEPVDPENAQIVTIDIEFNGEIMDTYPAQLGSVNRVVVKKPDEISKEQMDEYEKLFSFDDCQGEQTAYIVDNAYVIRTEELWDGKNASILAYAQMGTCGIKDLVEIIMPLNKIRDENGNAISVSGLEAGRCIEFAYTSVTEGEAGSPVFNVKADYLTVKAESVEVSEETIRSAMNAWEIE